MMASAPPEVKPTWEASFLSASSHAIAIDEWIGLRLSQGADEQELRNLYATLDSAWARMGRLYRARERRAKAKRVTTLEQWRRMRGV